MKVDKWGMGIDFFRDGEEIRKRKKVRFFGGAYNRSIK
jgi:hypothetical protein